MYRAFELNLGLLREECSSDDEKDRSIILNWYKTGRKNGRKDKNAVEESLMQIIKAKTIDGLTLRDTIFPTFKKDIFISHSHNDEKLMYIIAGMLQEVFGLTVFADEFFWGSADKLLHEFDDLYCRKLRPHTYEYNDRNLTTSHVHVMLSTAIMEAINQCEVFLFLNTDNSIPDISAPDLAERFKDGRYTMSPWIYQELLIASMIKPVIPERLAHTVVLEEGLSIAYRLSQNIRETICPLTLDDILSWNRFYKYRTDTNIHALDCLYAQKKAEDRS